MYQGKFDQKKKGATLSVEEIVASRNSAAPAKKEAPVRPAPQKAAPAAEPKKRSVPYDQDAHVSKKPPVSEAPVKASKKASKEVQAEPRRKGPRLGGVIFYTLYFLFIFLFFVAVFFLVVAVV